MARLRTLKPGFFTNEVLAEVEPLGRLLFQGLWCLADREGRLADRPRRIKVEALPYDDCDVEDLLAQLEARDFILRYEAGGEPYIQIVNFLRHQSPHVKEAPSAIPAPPGYTPPTDPGGFDPDTGGAPDEHGASLVLVPDEHQNGTTPSALSLGSGNLVVGSGKQGVRAVRELYSAPFEEGWSLYPLKVGKHAAWTKWQALVRQGESTERMVAACRHYGDECRRSGKEARYILHGQTFFGPQRRYLDYVAGVPETGPPPTALPKSWAAIAAVRQQREGA